MTKQVRWRLKNVPDTFSLESKPQGRNAMADELIFYTNPMSRGQIVRWMLEEVGVPYEPRILDYGTTMKDAAYLAVNPMGKVPAIVHNGKAVTECAAICAYLADAFPEADLAPAPADRADYYRWMFFTAGRSEEHTSELQSLMRIQYAVFCLQ